MNDLTVGLIGALIGVLVAYVLLGVRAFKAETALRFAAADQVALRRVREALARHPRACDRHPDEGPVSCGWKRAVMDVQDALDGDA